MHAVDLKNLSKNEPSSRAHKEVLASWDRLEQEWGRNHVELDLEVELHE